jgi:hypothetical protein
MIGAFSKKTYEVTAKEKGLLSKEVSPINKEVNLFSKAMNSDRKMPEAGLKLVTPMAKKEEGRSMISQTSDPKPVT